MGGPDSQPRLADRLGRHTLEIRGPNNPAIQREARDHNRLSDRSRGLYAGDHHEVDIWAALGIANPNLG